MTQPAARLDVAPDPEPLGTGRRSHRSLDRRRAAGPVEVNKREDGCSAAARLAQGLPPTVNDPVVLARVAVLLRAAAPQQRV